MNYKQKKFHDDEKWGSWGEGQMIKFIEDFFNRGEKFVSYWLSSKDISSNKKDLKAWDLKFGCYTLTDRKNYYSSFEVEVKTDGYETNTGNVCFEKSYKGKESGVFSTKAKYFLYFMPLFENDNIYLIKSDQLRPLLREFDTHIVPGGDRWTTTMMYIIPKSDFNDKFINAGGKIITWNEYKIPSDFEKIKFQTKSVIYSSNDIKDYEDPFNFGYRD